jgi:hypothetical protein
MVETMLTILGIFSICTLAYEYALNQMLGNQKQYLDQNKSRSDVTTDEVSAPRAEMKC